MLAKKNWAPKCSHASIWNHTTFNEAYRTRTVLRVTPQFQPTGAPYSSNEGYNGNLYNQNGKGNNLNGNYGPGSDQQFVDTNYSSNSNSNSNDNFSSGSNTGYSGGSINNSTNFQFRRFNAPKIGSFTKPQQYGNRYMSDRS